MNEFITKNGLLVFTTLNVTSVFFQVNHSGRHRSKEIKVDGCSLIKRIKLCIKEGISLILTDVLFLNPLYVKPFFGYTRPKTI